MTGTTSTMANLEGCTRVKLAAWAAALGASAHLLLPQELEQVIRICRRVKSSGPLVSDRSPQPLT